MTYRKEIITRLTALVLSLSMMTTAYAVKPNEVTEPLEMERGLEQAGTRGLLLQLFLLSCQL